VTMDRLPSDKQELVRKSSTERLRLKILQIGWEEVKMLALDRAELLEAAAEVTLVAERSETVIKETLPANGNSPGSTAASDAVRLRERELEERRREREYEERRVEREERAADRECEEKAAEREEKVKAADREEKATEREERARTAERDLELRRIEYEFRKLEMTRVEPQRQVGTDMGFGLDGGMAWDPRSRTLWRGVPEYLRTLASRASRFTPNDVPKRRNAPIFRDGRKTFRTVRRS